MDLSDFIVTVASARVRSPRYHDAIVRLHARGYTSAQMQASLASEGVHVTRQRGQQYAQIHGMRAHTEGPG